MAGENIELVRRVFDAFGRGDVEEFLGYLDDDVDWGVSAYLTGERDLRGREAVGRWMADVASLEAAGERLELSLDQFRELDENTVLVIGSGRLEREHSPLEEQLGWIWRIEEGRVVAMTDYLSHEEALEAAEALE